MTGGSEGNFEYIAKGNRNSAASPRLSEGEYKGRYTRSRYRRK